MKRFSGVHVIVYLGLNEMIAFCKVELEDESGRASLSWAAQGGQEAVVLLLIERGGVDINAKEKCGKTPLMWAAEYGHMAVVRLLVERNDVDISVKDKDGQTPLSVAGSASWVSESSRKATVQLLKNALELRAQSSGLVAASF